MSETHRSKQYQIEKESIEFASLSIMVSIHRLEERIGKKVQSILLATSTDIETGVTNNKLTASIKLNLKPSKNERTNRKNNI